jgi:hypothetical protein
MTAQLYELARRFPDAMIERKPGAKFSAEYVSHGTVTARLLEVAGPFDWSIAKVITNAEGIAVGCIGRLQVTIDGRPTVIEEVGDCENITPNSASNLMVASSTAIKRAAMRLGLGLHLWVGTEHYYLDRSLEKRLRASESDDTPSEGKDTGAPSIGAQQALQSAEEAF